MQSLKCCFTRMKSRNQASNRNCFLVNYLSTLVMKRTCSNWPYLDLECFLLMALNSYTALPWFKPFLFQSPSLEEGWVVKICGLAGPNGRVMCIWGVLHRPGAKLWLWCCGGVCRGLSGFVGSCGSLCDLVQSAQLRLLLIHFPP